MNAKAIIAMAAIAIPMGVLADGGIRWLDRVHDFGAFDEDVERISTDFRFVNETDEDVTILQVSSTCGCTVPSYSNGVIAPGDTASIHVEYNAIGRPGRFDKQIYVRTSADHERYKLAIKGSVIGNAATVKARYPVDMGALKLHTAAAMMGRVHKGKGKMEYVDGYNQSADSLHLVFANVPEYLEVTAIPAVVAPGDLANINIYFRGDKVPQYGIVTDSLQIAVNPGESFYTLPVVAIVEEDFGKLSAEELKNAPSLKIDVDRIDLGTVPMGSTQPVTAKIKLSNAGHDPLLIRRIYSTDPAVSASIATDTLKKGKSAEMTISYDPSANPDQIVNTRLNIIVNDPLAPTRTLRIVASRQ